MKPTHWIAALAMLSAALNAEAAVITLNVSVPADSAEITPSGPTIFDVRYSATTSAFTVNNGDTVRVQLLFDGGATFQLLNSDGGLGTQGRLIRENSLAPVYRVEHGFTFSLLDSDANTISSDTAARAIVLASDLLGNVTLPPVISPIQVGGFLMEFADIENAFEGGLPQTFNGVLFDLTNVRVGAASNGAVPEPTSIMVWGLGVIGCAVTRRRRRK